MTALEEKFRTLRDQYSKELRSRLELAKKDRDNDLANLQLHYHNDVRENYRAFSIMNAEINEAWEQMSLGSRLCMADPLVYEANLQKLIAILENRLRDL